MNKAKLKGFVRDYRCQIKKELQLNDAEVRLFRLYLRLADWDKRHKDSFGKVAITVRETAQLLPQPGWSTGKISAVRRSLKQKGWISIEGRSTIVIPNYHIWRIKDIQEAEQEFQSPEQIVQPSEQAVQPVEHLKENSITNSVENQLQKSDFVQPTEQVNQPKETLKKYKENLNNDFKNLSPKEIARLVREQNPNLKGMELIRETMKALG